jgi:hypothetical protein
VHAATTHHAKLALLAKAGFVPHLIQIGVEISSEAPPLTPPQGGEQYRSDSVAIGSPHCRTIKELEKKEDFWSSETIVVTLPFRRQFPDPWIYVAQMREIVSKLSSHQRVLLTSSTSYYPDCDHSVDEDLAFSPISPRLKALAAAESVIVSHPGPSAVLRLGGLYGPGREIRGFAKKGLERRALGSRVNLIHRDDVIAIVRRMVCDDVGWGCALNAVSDAHPSRGDLYGVCAVAAVSQVEKGKIVSNQKLKMALDYQFCYPDPLALIEDFSQ